jgi:hypothetical protein
VRLVAILLVLDAAAARVGRDGRGRSGAPPQRVEHHHVHSQPRCQPAAVADAEHLGGLRRESAYRRHRQYHADFSYSDDERCIANADCSGCRHYVSGYSKSMAELDHHLHRS